jgi:hypothetical protein
MTAFEFEARLRTELREAAEREQRRGVLARCAAAARALAPPIGQSLSMALAVATVVLIAVAAVTLISRTGHHSVARPKVVAHLKMGESLGSPIAAYGSIWLSDGRDALLRIDPNSRAVTARLPVRGDATAAAGAGALWVLQEGPPAAPLHQGPEPAGYPYRGPLLRIDPSTNRVTARIPLRTPEGEPVDGFRVLADGHHVWVTTRKGALRIDPQSDTVTTPIWSRFQFVGSDFALSPDGLWARTADRRLLRFDPGSGALLSSVRLALGQTGDAPLVTRLGDGLAASVPGGLARVDPHTGRILWRRQVGQRLSGWTELGGLIWARSSGGTRDRLSALDPNTGRILTSVGLADYAGSGVAAVDDELWLPTVGGTVEILRP